MLFIHEFHKVVGKRAAAFEAAYRDDWMPALAEGSDARLAWYFDLAHGSGLAYRVVTVTAVADGAAYVRLAERVARGDLQAVGPRPRRAPARVPRPGHDAGAVVTGHPRVWPTSPPTGSPRAVTMYMEDTMWPFPGRLRDYVEAAGAVYRPSLGAEDARMHMNVALGTETVPGAGRSPEVTLMQRLSSLPPLIRAPHPGHPARGHRARVVDARSPRPPGPVAVEAAADRAVVAAAMTGPPSIDQRPTRRRSTGRWLPVLFVHETHRVIGRHAPAFEELVRDEWMPALARAGRHPAGLVPQPRHGKWPGLRGGDHHRGGRRVGLGGARDAGRWPAT